DSAYWCVYGFPGCAAGRTTGARLTNCMTWQEEIEKITADRRTGAIALAASTARALITLSNEVSVEQTSELVQILVQVAEQVLEAQTGMASLVTLYNRILFAVSSESDGHLALGKLRDTAQAYLTEQQRVNAELSRRAVALIPYGMTIATHSASGTVLSTFKLAVQTGRSPMVICHESRPGFEGRSMARDLGIAGIPVRLTADAAMADNLRLAELVLVGADSLTESGIIAKLGTAALSTCARWLGIPCYILADTGKIWPNVLGNQPIKNRPKQELWDTSPTGIEVENPYYDVTSWEVISGVVTEQGLMSAKDIRDM